MRIEKKLALAAIFLVAFYCLIFILNLFRADASFNKGEQAKRYGLYGIAAENYQKAIALNPREPRYHRELAYVLATQGVVEEAEREAEAAYNLNPKNSLTVRSLISTYVELVDLDSKYLARAEELITEAIAQQPTNPQLHYEQALIFLRAEKNKEALAASTKAVTLKPDYRRARELLESFQ